MKSPDTPWNFGFVSLTSSKEILNIDKSPECLEDNDSHRPIIHKLTSSRHEKSSAGLWVPSGVGVIGRHGFQPSASPFRSYRREVFEKRMDLKVGKLAAAGVRWHASEAEAEAEMCTVGWNWRVIWYWSDSG